MMLRTTLAVALLAGPWLAGCGPRPPQDPLQVAAWEHGIEILGVQLMADGEFARVNYRVVDYKTAKRALRGNLKLLPEKSDRPLPMMSTGRLGNLIQRPSSTGRPQFMMFTNRGQALRRGDRAVLIFGENRIAGIPVS